MRRTILLPKCMSSSWSDSDMRSAHQLFFVLTPASSVDDLVMDFFSRASPLLSTSWIFAKYKHNTYERVAVGRKYPCSRPLWICLLWLLLQSLFHVQLGWNFNTKQPLYVQPFCLWPDENPLAWSGAIHHQKKAIILAVNCQSHQYFAHYRVFRNVL